MKAEDISKVRLQRFNQLENENFGHTKHAIWYKISIVNESQEGLLLQIGPEWTSNIQVFKIDEYDNYNFNKAGGVLAPYAERDIKSNKHLFDLKMEENEQAVFFIKISGNHIISPHFTIGNRGSMSSVNRMEDRMHFMYIGIILLLVLYNVVVTTITRKRSFLYYSLYIICMTLNVLFNKGYPNEWADLFWVSNHHSIFSALAIAFIVLSIASVTKVKTLYPLLH